MIAYIFMRCTNTTARMTTTAFLKRNSHDSFILSVPVRSFGGFILSGRFLDSYRTFVCHINSPLFMSCVIRFLIACWGKDYRQMEGPTPSVRWHQLSKAFYRALRAATYNVLFQYFSRGSSFSLLFARITIKVWHLALGLSHPSRLGIHLARYRMFGRLFTSSFTLERVRRKKHQHF